MNNEKQKFVFIRDFSKEWVVDLFENAVIETAKEYEMYSKYLKGIDPIRWRIVIGSLKLEDFSDLQALTIVERCIYNEYAFDEKGNITRVMFPDGNWESYHLSYDGDVIYKRRVVTSRDPDGYEYEETYTQNNVLYGDSNLHRGLIIDIREVDVDDVNMPLSAAYMRKLVRLDDDGRIIEQHHVAAC